MKTPPGLQPLIDDGVIDEVIRPLKSGKEASVYVVRSGDEIRCAKVYKDMAQRSFQAQGAIPGRPQGARQPAGARDRQGNQVRPQGAGDGLEEHRSGCAVPVVRRACPGSAAVRLLQRRAGDGTGHRQRRPFGAAARAKSSSSPTRPAATFVSWSRQVVRMLCLGLIHGDLSEYNVLVAPEGPGHHRPAAGSQRGGEQQCESHAPARRQQHPLQPGPLRA